MTILVVESMKIAPPLKLFTANRAIKKHRMIVTKGRGITIEGWISFGALLGYLTILAKCDIFYTK